MTDISDQAIETKEPKLLGPFLGHVTPNSIKIWLHFEGESALIYVSVYSAKDRTQTAGSGQLNLSLEKLHTDCVTIGGLLPDTKYFYRLWTDAAQSAPLDLQGLSEDELHFQTLLDNPDDQIDFLIMSCHNPTVSTKDGFDGLAVWADIPQIIATESNRSVRFALLVGDQVYADDWQAKVLEEPDEERRRHLYLDVYRKFWSNIHYRRVLCSLPSMMMWDDHDITDGWGSEEKSFIAGTDEFKLEWKGLFDAASSTFGVMQASRNPAPLSDDPKDGYDCCFRFGKLAFILLDLRTHRNLRRQKLMMHEQFNRIKKWVADNKNKIDTVFFVSPVVFSHGSPVIDDFTESIWPTIMDTIDQIAENWSWGTGLQTKFSKTLGDIRDDIRDSWGSKANASEAETILEYMFGLQNDLKKPVNVIVLSGDIHTSGYSSIYSNAFRHRKRATIPHVTSSSVSYSPFNWLVEAIYRISSKTVALGTSETYNSQISHHFCYRSVAVLSVRRKQGESDLLKVKYYLEGFPEPQILLFDLNHTSHQENIAWVAQTKLYTKEYSPTANVDVEALLAEKASKHPEPLNWDTSIVDLLKLLKMDSRLGARKLLAVKLGFQGPFDGSSQMNDWLLRELKQKLQEGSGNINGLH